MCDVGEKDNSGVGGIISRSMGNMVFMSLVFMFMSWWYVPVLSPVVSMFMVMVSCSPLLVPVDGVMLVIHVLADVVERTDHGHGDAEVAGFAEAESGDRAGDRRDRTRRPRVVSGIGNSQDVGGQAWVLRDDLGHAHRIGVVIAQGLLERHHDGGKRREIPDATQLFFQAVSEWNHGCTPVRLLYPALRRRSGSTVRLRVREPRIHGLFHGATHLLPKSGILLDSGSC